MMRKMHNPAHRLFWIALVACMLYQSYRYPLQMNFSGTSPTYSDTPAALQYGKYGMLILLASFAGIVSRGARLNGRALPCAFGMMAISAFPVIKFLYDQDARHLIFPCVVVTVFALVSSINKVHVRDLSRFIRVGLYFSLLVNALQIALFVVVGRLPALAYEDSLSVRFGSFLDDPNGFGGLLFLFCGYLYVRTESRRDKLLLAAVLISFLMTQSLTAISFLLLLIFLAVGKNLLRHPIYTAVLLTAMTITAAVYALPLYELYDQFYQLKSGSIEGHLSWISISNLSGIWHWFIGSDSYSPSESWWLGSLGNYGLVWTGLLALLGFSFVWDVIRKFRRVANIDSRAVLFGVGLYGLYMMVASSNLPFFTVFPNNVLFLVFFFLFKLDKIEFSRRGEQVEPALPLRQRRHRQHQV